MTNVVSWQRENVVGREGSKLPSICNQSSAQLFSLLLLLRARPLFCCFVYTLHSYYTPEARSLAVLSVRLLLYHNITRERLTDFLQSSPPISCTRGILKASFICIATRDDFHKLHSAVWSTYHMIESSPGMHLWNFYAVIYFVSCTFPGVHSDLSCLAPNFLCYHTAACKFKSGCNQIIEKILQLAFMQLFFYTVSYL